MPSLAVLRFSVFVILPFLLLLVAARVLAETELHADVEAQQKSDASLLHNAVRYGRRMGKDEVVPLEKRLEAEPGDLVTRAKLLGYYFYQGVGNEGRAETIKARRRHIIWLIEEHPESALAGMSESSIDPSGHGIADKVGYETASSMWRAWVGRDGVARQVIDNAFNFLRLNDKPEAEKIAKKAGDPYLLGQIYAWGVIRASLMNQNGLIMSTGSTREDERYAEHAVEALRATDDKAVLDVATSILIMQGAMVQVMNQQAGKTVEPEPVAFAGELLERCSECRSHSTYYKITGMMSRSPAEKKEMAQKELDLLENGSATPSGVKPEEEKMWQLSRLAERAEVAFTAGEHAKAERYANEMLGLTKGETLDDSYGQAAHKGHVVLGRIALAKGDVKTASNHLLEAGNVKGGATLQSFGPNMALAKELLEHGERDVVIAYLKECKGFWDMGQKKLDDWIATIEKGETPNFGANLVY